MQLLEVLLDNKSAWTGLHLYVGGRQLAYASFDPTFPGGPKFSAAVGHRQVRFTVPHISWARAAKGGLLLKLYKHQNAFLHWADNRLR